MNVWQALLIAGGALFVASLLFLYLEFKNAPWDYELWPEDEE